MVGGAEMAGAALSTWVVTTGHAGEAQGAFAREAVQSQRQRFSVLLRGLDAEAWRSQTRCSEWNVHEVVRHLCDVTLKSTALLRGHRPEEVGTVGVDPRTTPVAWLSRSTGEQPPDTLRVFEDASAELLEEVDRRVGLAGGADVEWLYGTVPWSIAVQHVFWDAWVHERDILTPLGRQQESPALESRAAASYGLLMACLPLLIAGRPVRESVALKGDGGGVFRLDVGESGPSLRELNAAGYPATGQITVTVSEHEDLDNDVTPLHGALAEVVDSLVGRGPELHQVLQGPTERIAPLGGFRAFLLRPAT